MGSELKLGDVSVDLFFKDIKNIHLSVHPPTGRVRISAPRGTNREAIRLFAVSRLSWIRRQQKKLVAQERESPRDYVNRESHFVWGKRYLLKVIEHDAKPSVELSHRHLILRVRPGSEQDRRQSIMEAWYRQQLKLALPPLIAKWEPLLGVKLKKFFLQRMKTRWGSCNHRAGTIRLNSELAKKPPELLESVVVHELIHLLEPTHNARFVALMDQFMPSWQYSRSALNRLPVQRYHQASGGAFE